MVYFPGATLNDRFRGGETSRGRGAAAPEPLLSLLEGRDRDQRADDDSAFHRDSAAEDRSDPRGSESLVMDLSCVRGKSRFHFVLNMPLSGVTAVMGESGAGKTTFSQLIAGLIRPTEGFLRLGNRPFADTHRHFFLPPHKRGISMVFQDHRLFPHLTVRGNLTLAEKWGGRKARVALEDVARFFEITPFLDRKPGTLSGGESQRVSLARGVMAADSLLILDEALASLDPPRKARLLEQIAALPTLIDVPVLMITHSPRNALQVSEKAIGLSKGRIAATGDTRSVLASCGFLKEEGNNA